MYQEVVKKSYYDVRPDELVYAKILYNIFALLSFLPALAPVSCARHLIFCLPLLVDVVAYYSVIQRGSVDRSTCAHGYEQNIERSA